MNATTNWFRVRGVVEETETGRPLPGLVVRAFDRDPLFDDLLGFTVTDAAGGFEIHYREEAFRDLLEKSPDLYLRVFDPAGIRLLCETRDATRYDASRDEHFRISISGERLLSDGSR